jgi:2-polyprenyl-3-methyl-5-hydroxy-6-metoxy-1,4-benzoquinol methylase
MPIRSQTQGFHMRSNVDSSMGLEMRRFPVDKYPVSELVASVRVDYETKFGEPAGRPAGWYRPDDWHRVSYVTDLLRPGGDALDVGVGAGQFLNLLARSGKFRSVVGVDKTTYKKYTQLEPNMSTLKGDIANLQFEDNSFDVVTCMEVLEHIPSEVFLAGLAELRRVCRGQLIITVPFREPEPISRFHVRRFEAADILELFPDASYTLLERPRMPWIMMEERFDGTIPGTGGNQAVTLASTTGDDDNRDTTIAWLRAQARKNRHVLRAARLIRRGARRVRSRLRH